MKCRRQDAVRLTTILPGIRGCRPDLPRVLVESGRLFASIAGRPGLRPAIPRDGRARQTGKMLPGGPNAAMTRLNAV
jgi:hypothetical protein